MKINILIIFLVCLLITGCNSTPTNVANQNSAAKTSKEEATLLIENMNLKVILDQTIEQMLQIQLNSKPQLKPYKDVMLRFFAKHMSYESLKPELIDIYASEFTATELKELNAFYSTPTGKKIIAKTPQLSAKGAQIGAQRVQNNLQELREMIEAETKRIKESKSS